MNTQSSADTERFTKKPWGNYPRCQFVNDYDKQCRQSVYSSDLCWGHFQDLCAGRIPDWQPNAALPSNDGSKQP
jgi:hypothetical protein